MPRSFFVAFFALSLVACSDGPPIIGDLTQKDVCRAVEQALRKQLDMFVISEGQECAVTVGPDNAVEVASRYKSPLGGEYDFVARGRFSGEQLELAEIQVEEETKGFVPFVEFQVRR